LYGITRIMIRTAFNSPEVSHNFAPLYYLLSQWNME